MAGARKIERKTSGRGPAAPRRAAGRGPAALRNAQAPRYEQLKRQILDRIAAGEWRDGRRLPSEHELVQQYGMSRMTVHRALRELSAQGVVTRRKGIGTFALPPAPRSELLAIRDIAEDVVKRGHRHRCDVLVREQLRADVDLATSFSKAVGARLFHSVLVHFEDDTAIQLEERYVNPSFAPRYLAVDFTRTTPARYLRELGAPTEVEHIIFAGFPKDRQRRMLGMRRGEPCLFLMRRTWYGEITATRSLFVYPAGRYSLGSRYRITPAGTPVVTG